MNWKINKDNYGALAVGLIIGVVVFFLLRHCQKPVTYVPIDLKKDFEVKDSFRTIIRYQDSTRVTFLKKWRTITQIKDSTPCYTEIVPIIQACDTVILVDSIEITSLKNLVKVDSVIQSKLIEKIQSDSTDIAKLNRKLKMQKIMTKAAFILGFGSGGFLGFEVKN